MFSIQLKNVFSHDLGTISIAPERTASSGAFADRVIRDENGFLKQVLDFPFNASRKAVEGIDLTAVYEYPTDNFGKFTIAAAYNHLLRFNLQVENTAGFTNALGRFANVSASTYHWSVSHGSITSPERSP